MKPIHIKLGKGLDGTMNWMWNWNCETHLGFDAANQLDLLMKIHMLLLIHLEVTIIVCVLKENQVSYFKGGRRVLTFGLLYYQQCEVVCNVKPWVWN